MNDTTDQFFFCQKPFMFTNEDYSRSNGSNIIDIDWLNVKKY
jgi:hypothetical protein